MYQQPMPHPKKNLPLSISLGWQSGLVLKTCVNIGRKIGKQAKGIMRCRATRREKVQQLLTPGKCIGLLSLHLVGMIEGNWN